LSQLIDDAAFLASVSVAGSILITGAAWGIRKAVKLSHRMGDFLDDFVGKPARPGVPAVVGVMVRLQALTEDQAAFTASRTVLLAQIEAGQEAASVERAAVKEALGVSTLRVDRAISGFDQRLTVIQDQVQVIHHEMIPNEGQSMKDQINRVDAVLTAPEGDSMKDQVTRIDEHTKPN
jgi:hypothetical protein